MMRRNIVILCVIGLIMLFGLNGPPSGQTPGGSSEVPYDTTRISVIYSSAYPGSNHLVEVKMRNRDEYVMGYNFTLAIGSTTLGRFSEDESGNCIIDTTGCLASVLNLDSCAFYNDNHDSVEHAASTSQPPWIDKRVNYAPLFRIQMDVCCIPDSVSQDDRITTISLSGQLFNSAGNEIPYIVKQGDFRVWWSVPGDASSDSVVDVGDIVYLQNYLYQNGPEPCVCEAADCNNDSVIDLGDIVYLTNYLYRSGPAPVRGSVYCWHDDCWP